MRTRIHSRDFGVLEIIVSVAILAAFSVFVLRLFVSASADRRKTVQLDAADYYASSLIERFKGGSTPFDVCASLGGSPSAGGYSGSAGAADGLTARISIRKADENNGGSLYTLRVELSGTDGKALLNLEGEQYFAGYRAGDTVG